MRKNIRKKTIQKCKNSNPQEHLELRNILYSRANEHEIVTKPDTLLEEPCFHLGTEMTELFCVGKEQKRSKI